MKIDPKTKYLIDKAAWVRRETIKIHKTARETRLASSLSAVEILTVLYFGGIIKYFPKDTNSEKRDRFIISKGHGSIALYPILAELGYFNKRELNKVCSKGSFLGGIPDPSIPGYETINGSLGHGLGIACGISIALNAKKRNEKVYTLLGDGELYEGSVWEAIMLAGEKRLNNLIAIIDNNKISMLDYCKNIIDLEPIDKKFRDFKWKTWRIDGHNVAELSHVLRAMASDKTKCPKLLVADTVKGKGVPSLQSDRLCHVKTVSDNEILRCLYKKGS